MISKFLSSREEYLKKKRKARLLKLALALFLSTAIFAGLVFLSRLQKFRIAEFDVSGNVLVSANDVSIAAQNFLSGNYFWFFPKNNDLLYSRHGLEKTLSEKFRRIAGVSVHLKNFRTLSIAITERSLNALWCDGEPNSVLPENCWFMDDNGLIFAPAPQFSGDAYFKYYGLVSATTSPIGQPYLASTTEFQSLTEFVKRADDFSLQPIYLQDAGQGQFIVGLSGGGQIYIDANQSLSKEGDNLEALLGIFSASTTPLDFDYIDLRFGDKLYYKMK
jgi:hypothetical protein